MRGKRRYIIAGISTIFLPFRAVFPGGTAVGILYTFDLGIFLPMPYVICRMEPPCIAAAIGWTGSTDYIDLDAMMTNGEMIMFNIAPIAGAFDGGEIWGLGRCEPGIFSLPRRTPVGYGVRCLRYLRPQQREHKRPRGRLDRAGTVHLPAPRLGYRSPCRVEEKADEKKGLTVRHSLFCH